MLQLYAVSAEYSSNLIMKRNSHPLPPNRVSLTSTKGSTQKTQQNQPHTPKNTPDLFRRRHTHAQPMRPTSYDPCKRAYSLFSLNLDHNAQLRLTSQPKPTCQMQLQYQALTKHYLTLFPGQSLQQDILNNVKFYLVVQNLFLLESPAKAKYFYASGPAKGMLDAIVPRAVAYFHYKPSSIQFFSRTGQPLERETPLDTSIFTLVVSPRIVYDEIYGKNKKTIVKHLDELEAPVRNTNDYEPKKNNIKIKRLQVNKILNLINTQQQQAKKESQKKSKAPNRLQHLLRDNIVLSTVRQFRSSVVPPKKLENILVSENLKKRKMAFPSHSQEIVYTFEQKKLKEMSKESLIEKNINQMVTHKSMKKLLDKKDNLLVHQNIPYLLQKYSLTRKELFAIYSEYKVLESVTSEKYPSQLRRLGQGIDYHSYLHGNQSASLQAEQLTRRHFRQFDPQRRGFMTWDQFLKLQDYLRARTFKDKLNVFCKTADVNSDGLLSYDEILELCQISLSINFQKEDQKEMLSLLSVYYTRLIFQITDIPMDQEIPLHHIKTILLDEFEKSSKNGALLAMFCGVDM